MGDTGVFGDMKLIADMYKPDLVLKPKAVVPMHYLTNPALPGTPAEFTKALGHSATQVMVPNPGDTTEF